VGQGFSHGFATLPPNVTNGGFYHDMREFYRQIKVLLVPSLVPEGFPRIILEAAANGIPAIANNTGGIPEALGESGVLIDLDVTNKPDIERLAACYVREIRRLLDDPAAYESFSNKARLRAQQHAVSQENAVRSFFQQHVH